MFEVAQVLALLGVVCWVTWRWLVQPIRDWLDYREKLTELRVEIERIRTNQRGGDDGDHV